MGTPKVIQTRACARLAREPSWLPCDDLRFLLLDSIMNIACRRRILASLGALVASGLLVHCGARTPLSDLTQPDAADAGKTDASTSDAKSDGAIGADASPESSIDAAQDNNVPDVLVPTCKVQPLGEPVEVLSINGQDLHTPSMAVIDPGSSTSAQLARVALQNIGGAIRLISLTVHEPTPSGTSVDATEPINLGGGMTYGQMVHAPEGLQQLALVWGADGPGNEFRTVDIPSWTPGPLVKVSQTGWTPNGLAAGKGVPNTQTGQYEGPGYGMTWQGPTGAAASMAVLSESGEIRVGPLSTSAPVPSEQLESTISWSGSTYLMATRFKSCAQGDPLCRELAVVVTRLLVAPASNSIVFASSFEVGTPGWSPGYPTLDGTFLVWDEGLSSKEPRVVHIEQLDPTGLPVGPDHVVSSGKTLLARPFLGSTPTGKLVGWAEEGNAGLPEDALGRSKLMIQVLKPELELDGAAIELPITRYGSMGHPVAVPLEYPRGVLVAWAARSRTTLQRSIFVQFLPCGS